MGVRRRLDHTPAPRVSASAPDTDGRPARKRSGDRDPCPPEAVSVSLYPSISGSSAATDDTMNTRGAIPAGRGAVRLMKLAVVVIAALTTFATTAVAADKPLGTFNTWSAMTFNEDDKTVCMMWSQPEKAEGDYKKRGEIFVFVTHRPGDQEMNKVSFETGYTFKESSEVRVIIDGTTYTLYTDGSTAWSSDVEDDLRMVNAMRAGRTMIMEGVSSRGTETKDTYSLSGFTAAHNAINKACRAK